MLCVCVCMSLAYVSYPFVLPMADDARKECLFVLYSRKTFVLRDSFH